MPTRLTIFLVRQSNQIKFQGSIVFHSEEELGKHIDNHVQRVVELKQQKMAEKKMASKAEGQKSNLKSSSSSGLNPIGGNPANKKLQKNPERAFTCEWRNKDGKICDKKCASQYELRSHICKHTGERPFSCADMVDYYRPEGHRVKDVEENGRVLGESKLGAHPGCDARFANRENAKRHYKMHHLGMTAKDIKEENAKNSNKRKEE
jgi:hypothetical protein